MADLFGQSDAVFSDCGRFRYQLRRRWSDAPLAVYVGLNPSTANVTLDDPTTRRLMRWERSWGYGGHVAVNLFAIVASRPEVAFAVPDPIGDLNDYWIMAAAHEARVAGGLILIGWGDGGNRNGRDREVLELLDGNALYCLGCTAAGHPIHPAARGRNRIPDDAMPRPWQPKSHGMANDDAGAMPFDIRDGRNRYEPCPNCKVAHGMGISTKYGLTAVRCAHCDFAGPGFEFKPPYDQVDRQAFEAWNQIVRLNSNDDTGASASEDG